MKKLFGGLFKIIFYATVVGFLVGAFFLTQSMTEHRESVGSKIATVEKSTLRNLNEMQTLNGVELSVTNTYISPINSEDTEIAEGSDYFIYYTLNITNKTGKAILYGASEIGYPLSTAYRYNEYPVSMESYETVELPPNVTVSLDFYVKTDEPSTELGYMINKAYVPEKDYVYIPFGDNLELRTTK